MASIVEGGISSFKIYMAYKNNMMLQEDEIYDALSETKRLGATVGFHCETVFHRCARQRGESAGTVAMVSSVDATTGA